MLLDKIVSAKKHEISRLKDKLALISSAQIKDLPAPRDFKQAIKQADKISLISEMKKASPSAGNILKHYDPAAIAGIYQEAGASALSVLTDHGFFHGKIEDLIKARNAVRLPALRKDFIIDESQITESRIAQADAVLLIVRLLDRSTLRRYLDKCQELSLSALVETHNEKEIEMALEAKAEIIGINNRDLNTLKVDFNRSFELIHKYPQLKEHILVSESGIKDRSQVEELKSAGFNAVLIGESILKSGSLTEKIKELIG